MEHQSTTAGHPFNVTAVRAAVRPTPDGARHLAFVEFSDCVEDLYVHLPCAAVDCDPEAMETLRRDIDCMTSAWERFRAVRGAGEAPQLRETDAIHEAHHQRQAFLADQICDDELPDRDEWGRYQPTLDDIASGIAGSVAFGESS